jgi:hypothetical protein
MLGFGLFVVSIHQTKRSHETILEKQVPCTTGRMGDVLNATGRHGTK